MLRGESDWRLLSFPTIIPDPCDKEKANVQFSRSCVLTKPHVSFHLTKFMDDLSDRWDSMYWAYMLGLDSVVGRRALASLSPNAINDVGFL